MGLPRRYAPRNDYFIKTFTIVLNFGYWALLSDTHQSKDSSEGEEQCSYPGREERREDSCFSEGEKDIEEDAIGEPDHHTDPYVQGDPPGPTGLEGERNSDEDHDQVQERVREFGIKIDKISGCIVTCGLDLLDIGSEFCITHFHRLTFNVLEGFPTLR